jgi:hypothetical protein
MILEVAVLDVRPGMEAAFGAALRACNRPTVRATASVSNP